MLVAGHVNEHFAHAVVPGTGHQACLHARSPCKHDLQDRYTRAAAICCFWQRSFLKSERCSFQGPVSANMCTPSIPFGGRRPAGLCSQQLLVGPVPAEHMAQLGAQEHRDITQPAQA